ncbi:hypothetical protein Tco_1125304 [Tanacetum coccineum]|uniref:Uncharacterized protein n=1 Tax=Tanacetum coccineum TaxID=301880 RepID=A0ABQ5J8M6_9ASTR
MTDKYFVEYTRIEVKHFKDTLLQHIGNVKKSVAERTRHQRQYDKRVNKRQLQTQESKIDTGKAVDADLVVIESSGTESEVQDDSSRSGNDTDADDAEIRPIYDEEPMVKVQLTAEFKSLMLDSSPDNQATDYSKQSLESENILLKKTVAQFQKDFSRMDKHISKNIEQTTSLLANNADLKAQIQEKIFAIVALKNDLRKLKGISVDTKPQMSKPWFASQVDVSNNLSKPVTQHYLPKRRESISIKPDHMIASSESRDSSKNVSRFSSNNMVHNHYLDEVRKKIQERDRNSKNYVYPYADFKALLMVANQNLGALITQLWIPTRKTFDSCTGKVDSELTHGSNVDIPNIHVCKQTLDLSAGKRYSIKTKTKAKTAKPSTLGMI